MAKTKAAAEPVEDGTREFTLDDETAQDLRDGPDDSTFDATLFWAEVGAEMGFVPTTVLPFDPPAEGPITFRAIPALEKNDDAGIIAGEAAGINDESDTDHALDNMENRAETFQLDSGTMAGDVAAGMLDIIKGMQKPFDQHSQIQKRELAARLDTIANMIVTRAVEIAAADGREVVNAYVDKIAIADKVMITLKLAPLPELEMEDAVAQVYRQNKKKVMIVTADVNNHMSKRRALVEDDQVEMPFDAGTDAGGEPAPGDNPFDAGGDAGDADDDGNPNE